MKTAKELNQIAKQVSVEELSKKDAVSTQKYILDEIEKAAYKGKLQRRCWFNTSETEYLETFFKELSDKGYQLEFSKNNSMTDLKISWSAV